MGKARKLERITKVHKVIWRVDIGVHEVIVMISIVFFK